MKKFLFVLSVLLFSSQIFLFANEKDENYPLRYDIVSTDYQGKQGFYIVEVSAYVTKKKEANTDIAKKCAVHGVLFKGFGGTRPQKAICKPGAEQEHADFFNAFFTSYYQNYVSTTGKPMQLMKSGKEFVVVVEVEVAKDALRQEMESAGIVKKLGF